MKSNKLRELLKSRKLTQREVASRMDMKFRTFIDKLYGRRTFKKSDIDKLLTVLDVTYEDIFDINVSEDYNNVHREKCNTQ